MSLWPQVGGLVATPLGMFVLVALGVFLVLVLARMFFRDRSGMNVRLKLWGLEMERSSGQLGQPLDLDPDEPAEVEAEKKPESGKDPGPGLAA